MRFYANLTMGVLLGFSMCLMSAHPAAAQASAPPPAQPEGFEWGYNKGFFFHNPQFELKISTRTQFRYTYRDFETDSVDRDSGAFNIPRARLRFDGYAWYPWLKYKIQYDFVGARDLCPSGGAGCDALQARSDLRDLYFDITRQPWWSGRLGQFKQPLGLQELTSSGDQEFVDRSIASTLFAPSREVGAMLYGTSFEKKFGYETAISNGNGRNKTFDNNGGMRYTVRVHFDPNGEYKLSESAVDHYDTVNWTIGVAAMRNNQEADILETTVPLRQDTGEAFFALKYKILFVMADYYLRTQEVAPDPAADPEPVDFNGFVTQVGVFVVPRKIELAARYSKVERELEDPVTSATTTTEGTEKRFGFGWYFSKHDLKFQADYGRTDFDADSTLISGAGANGGVLDAFRAQLQIVF
jgi:phosphate-selective porin